MKYENFTPARESTNPDALDGHNNHQRNHSTCRNQLMITDVSAAVEGVYALKKNIRFSLSRQMLIDCDWFTATCREGSFGDKTLDLIRSIGLERTDCFRDATFTIYNRSKGQGTALNAYRESLSCNGCRFL
ncbi:unnamed protein product [Adineta ricciae]|uniref:Peptidase C1A papain C-terminal domain-containing protein n=1 Tax=Adineta ricciae TaxID=249248 RepID=A0A815DS84_ADIRI|nr:unnamed protein product [Adineta ricciae]CAF1504978.1 unnamed protein product [Adineta ricciae]